MIHSAVKLAPRPNEAPPIHRTPTELLHYIFQHVLSLDCPDQLATYYRKLCSLSTVCTHWYSIIRNSPHLWTTVTGNVNEGGLPMILERSSECPVDIVYDMFESRIGIHLSADRLISFFKRVEPVAARWRNLTLSLDFDLFTSAVPDLLRWPCPNLERLALEDEASRLDFSEVDIFSGSSPKLTEVQVLGITFRWSHSIFKGLERLHLGYLEFDTIGTILNMLRESPRLQQLKIINCGTHLDLAAKPLPVPLPDLQFLHVLFLKSRKTAHLTPYSLFLDHVSAPLSCALFTNFRKREDEEDPIGPCFVRWLFGRQPRAVLEGVDTLELRLGHDDADTLQFILTSGLSTVKGGVRMWTPWHRNRMMACIRDIVNLSRAPRPYTKLNIGQHGARLFGPFIFQLDKFPPVTHLEMVDCGRPGYHDAIKYTLTERSSPTCSSIQSLAFRDFRSDVVNMVVQAALGGGGTLTSSESGRRTMEKIAIYVKSHEFPEMEAMVKTLRLDERIRTVELYTTL